MRFKCHLQWCKNNEKKINCNVAHINHVYSYSSIAYKLRWLCRLYSHCTLWFWCSIWALKHLNDNKCLMSKSWIWNTLEHVRHVRQMWVQEVIEQAIRVAKEVKCWTLTDTAREWEGGNRQTVSQRHTQAHSSYLLLLIPIKKSKAIRMGKNEMRIGMHHQIIIRKN